MAKYKNIKSALHNWTHSYMSIENHDEKGYFVQELYEVAKAKNIESLSINILTGNITPICLQNNRISDFLNNCHESFCNQLRSQNVKPNMITSAALIVKYDFSSSLITLVGFSFRDPWTAPKAATYITEVIAVDDRNETYNAKIQEWWR